MKFLSLLPFLAAAASAASWDGSLIQGLYYIGGENGDEFTHYAEAGQLVKKIRVYKNSSALRGIHIYYTDGTDAIIGSEKDDFKEFEFQDGEVIKSMSLWGDGKGKRCGRMKFDTDKGSSFDFGKDTGGQSEYAIEVGSGLLVGFAGRAGADVDALAPAFIKSIKSKYFDNISYSDFPKGGEGLSLKNVNRLDVTYQGADYQTTFKGTNTVAKSSTWKTGVSTSLTVGATFKAGVPEVAEVSTSIEWSVGAQHEWGETTTETSSVDYSIAVDVKSAEDEVRCLAEFWDGNVDIDWTGDLVIIGQDGSEYKIPSSGTLKQVDTTSIQATCYPLKGAPQPAPPGNPDPVSKKRGILASVMDAPTTLVRKVAAALPTFVAGTI